MHMLSFYKVQVDISGIVLYILLHRDNSPLDCAVEEDWNNRYTFFSPRKTWPSFQFSRRTSVF